MNSLPEQIGILDIIDDISTSERTHGLLCLLKNVNIFQITFRKLEKARARQVTAMTLTLPLPSSSGFSTGKPFCIDTSELSQLVLDSQLNLYIINNENKYRQFNFSEEQFPKFITFIEQIIVRGIAVPYRYHSVNQTTTTSICQFTDSICDKDYISFLFYPNCLINSYLPQQSHFHLEMQQFYTLEHFWTNVLSLFSSLISFFYSSNAIPRDPSYPLSYGAYAVSQWFLRDINKDIESLPKETQIKSDEWPTLFDSNGVIKDYEGLKNRIYRQGCTHDLICKVVPFLVGIYPSNSTSEERAEINRKLEKAFYNLKEQKENLLPEQIKNSKKMTSTFRVIDHDIARTDKILAPFKAANALGSVILRDLLQIYAVYNPKISYLQGMNDLFVPLLLAFIPDWTPEGQPLDNDYEKKLPLLFWTYDALLRSFSQLELLSHVSDLGMKQVPWINKILEMVSTPLEIWFKYHGLSEMQWMFSDFILLYKRSIENIWDLWLSICASPSPKSWLAYFTIALFCEGFQTLTELPDVSIPIVMATFPQFIKKTDIRHVNDIALCIWNRLEIEIPHIIPKETKSTFKFFNQFSQNDY